MKKSRNLVQRGTEISGLYDSVDPEHLIRLREEKKAELQEDLHKHIKFEIDKKYYDYDPNEYVCLYMKWLEYESDDEYEKRIAQEKQFEAEKLARDRAEFERLRKQFGA